jgi:beta-glucanase (GH16 family)
MYGQGQSANPSVEISQRPVPQEPMYLLANLGISFNFGGISENLVLPATMRIDYIRVYQPKNAINIGCDPKDFPTADYIERWVLLAPFLTLKCEDLY